MKGWPKWNHFFQTQSIQWGEEMVTRSPLLFSLACGDWQGYGKEGRSV